MMTASMSICHVERDSVSFCRFQRRVIWMKRQGWRSCPTLTRGGGGTELEASCIDWDRAGASVNKLLLSEEPGLILRRPWMRLGI
ncbi:hypothetical protein Dimus_029848 [Dionaea muscipula]